MNIGELKASIAGLSEDTPVILQIRSEVPLSDGESYITSSYVEAEAAEFDNELGEFFLLSEIDA